MGGTPQTLGQPPAKGGGAAGGGWTSPQRLYKPPSPSSLIHPKASSLSPLSLSSPELFRNIGTGLGEGENFPLARRGAGGLWICLNLFHCSADPEFGRENLFAASPWYPRGATRVALIIGLSGNSTSSSTTPRLPRPRLCGSVIPLTIFKGMIPYSSVYSYLYICIA